MKNKSEIDFYLLSNKIDNKIMKLSKKEVSEKFVSLGFDIVKFKDADKGAELWQIQSGEDGDYIVALYQAEDDIEKTAAKKTDWSVSINKVARDIQISYKGDPLVSVASSALGLPPEEVDKIPGYLPNRLAENKQLVQSLLNQLDKTTKNQVLNKYPELF